MKLENIVRNKSTFSNVLKLMTGTVIAQGIGILIMPVLARLYNPAAFGILAVYVSIATILGAVACGRYELAIMLPKEDREAANLFWLSTAITLATSALIFLAVVFTGETTGYLLKTPGIVPFLWLIPFSVLGIGSYLSLNYWSSRKKMFGRLSISRVIQSSSNQGTKLTAGFITMGNVGGLVAGKVLSDVVASMVLAFQVFRDDKHVLKQGLNWEGIKEAARRYRKFPLFDSWSAVLNTASQQLPTLLLAFYFSPKIVGFYALGRAVLGMPMGLVGGAVAQVFFQKASEAHNRTGNLSEVVEEVFNRLVSLGIFPILLLTLIGKDVFIVAFGARWAEAGVYMQILGLWLFFVFISSPISTLFSVLEKQSYGLFFNVILFVTRAISLIWGGMIGDARIALILFSGTGAIAFSVMTFWLLSCANVSLFRTLNIFFKKIVICIPILSIVALCKFSFDLAPIWVILIGVTGSFPYYVIILKQDRELQKPIRLLAKKLGFVR